MPEAEAGTAGTTTTPIAAAAAAARHTCRRTGAAGGWPRLSLSRYPGQILTCVLLSAVPDILRFCEARVPLRAWPGWRGPVKLSSSRLGEGAGDDGDLGVAGGHRGRHNGRGGQGDDELCAWHPSQVGAAARNDPGPQKFLPCRLAAGLLLLLVVRGAARSAGRRNRAGNSCSLAGDGTLIRRSGAPGDRGSRIGRAAAERAGGHGGAEATGQELHLLASKAEVHRRHWLSGVAAAAPWDLMEVDGNSLVGFRDNAGAGTIGVSGRNWGTGCRMSRG